MTASGTASSKPRPNTTGVVRRARAVAEGGNGSESIPRACFSAPRTPPGVLHRCRSPLDFVAGTDLRRRLMALTAAGRVEQRAEPRLRGDVAVESDLPLGEAIPLRGLRARSQPAASSTSATT